MSSAVPCQVVTVSEVGTALETTSGLFTGVVLLWKSVRGFVPRLPNARPSCYTTIVPVIPKLNPVPQPPSPTLSMCFTTRSPRDTPCDQGIAPETISGESMDLFPCQSVPIDVTATVDVSHSCITIIKSAFLRLRPAPNPARLILRMCSMTK